MDNKPERPKLSQQYCQPPKTATKKGSVLTQLRTGQLIEVERRRREQHAQDQASSRSVDAFANRDDTPEPSTLLCPTRSEQIPTSSAQNLC